MAREDSQVLMAHSVWYQDLDVFSLAELKNCLISSCPHVIIMLRSEVELPGTYPRGQSQ